MPLIAAYFARHGQVPAKMALGLAAMLRFLKVAKTAGEKCYGTWHGQEYLLQDDNAHLFAQNAQHKDPCTAVGEILADTNLWGLNAAKFAGLPEAVANYLRYLENASKAEVAQLFLPHPQFQNA
ncbi:MAG TPA: hypothetical protein PKD90_10870 [Phnomibacter sp.]|nr:hypothetical protein [Phnomibacter sp.]